MPTPRAPYSLVVIDQHYLHIAGIVAADFPAGVTVLGDAEAETRAILQKVAEILGELNASMQDIVRCDVHLADLLHFDAMDAAYRTFFAHGHYPARTTTQSARLFGDSLVEITCMVSRNGAGL